jgi:hypothetical protein
MEIPHRANFMPQRTQKNRIVKVSAIGLAPCRSQTNWTLIVRAIRGRSTKPENSANTPFDRLLHRLAGELVSVFGELLLPSFLVEVLQNDDSNSGFDRSDDARHLRSACSARACARRGFGRAAR